jgi:hypothetical protein
MDRSKIMLVAVVIAVPLLISVADVAWTQGQEQNPVTVYKSDGIYATYDYNEFRWDLPEGGGTGGTYYSRSARVELQSVQGMGTGGTFQPYQLTYNISAQEPMGYGYANGSCAIPEELVTLSKNKKEISVSVDTSSFASCSGFQYGSILVPKPVIDLTWKQTNESWTRTEGHTKRQIGDYRIFSLGTTVENSAEVSGSVTIPPLDPPGDVDVSGTMGFRRTMDRMIYTAPK